MGRVTICDKCNKEIKLSFWGKMIVERRGQWSYFYSNLEFCEKCDKDFKKWLKQT